MCRVQRYFGVLGSTDSVERGRVLADAESHGVLASTRVMDTEGSITCCVEDGTVGGEECRDKTEGKQGCGCA